MARPRKNGRFCSEAEASDGTPRGVQEKKERPVKCIHEFTDREFRKQFRGVFKGLMKKAEEGSVQQIRLLLQIGKFDDPKAARKRGAKGLGAMLLEELKRRQDEREAAMQKTAEASASTVETTQVGSGGDANDGIAAKE